MPMSLPGSRTRSVSIIELQQLSGPSSKSLQHARETKLEFERMSPIGTPELVLLLVALAGMTVAATWGVIELKKPRR
jgi:hypothetical protein